MIEDYEFNETPCPQCAHEPTHIRDCMGLECDNGQIDISDENYEVEGSSFERCNTCYGTGIEHWCPKCCYDLNNKDWKALKSKK